MNLHDTKKRVPGSLLIAAVVAAGLSSCVKNGEQTESASDVQQAGGAKTGGLYHNLSQNFVAQKNKEKCTPSTPVIHHRNPRRMLREIPMPVQANASVEADARAKAKVDIEANFEVDGKIDLKEIYDSYKQAQVDSSNNTQLLEFFAAELFKQANSRCWYVKKEIVNGKIQYSPLAKEIFGVVVTTGKIHGPALQYAAIENFQLPGQKQLTVGGYKVLSGKMTFDNVSNDQLKFIGYSDRSQEQMQSPHAKTLWQYLWNVVTKPSHTVNFLPINQPDRVKDECSRMRSLYGPPSKYVTETGTEVVYHASYDWPAQVGQPETRKFYEKALVVNP